MGEYWSKTCCLDRGTLITNENNTSRMNSPVNFEFQRVIMDFKDIDQKVNEQFIDNDSPESKPRMLRRTLSGISETVEGENFVRAFKRSSTLKGKENFLKRAKNRMLTISNASIETPKEHEDFHSFGSKVREFENVYMNRPDGDLDCDAE